MSEKNKKEEKNINLIPQRIIESITSIDPEILFRNETCPAYFLDSFNISEILDETKKKERKRKGI